MLRRHHRPGAAHERARRDPAPVTYHPSGGNSGGNYEIASLDNVMPTPVPEPSPGVLMVLGLAGVALRARRNRRVGEVARWRNAAPR